MLLPPDYYSPTLLGLRTEQAVFAELLAWKLPRLSAHLEKHAVVAELFVTRWFVAIFANALPVETTLRVWDAFLLEGVKVLHRIGLAVLRVAEPRLLACRSAAAPTLCRTRGSSTSSASGDWLSRCVSPCRRARGTRG